MRRLGGAAGLLLTGALFAELGHALAYGVRRPAGLLPPDAAHVYFRPVLESAVTVLAAILLGSLLVLGLARLLRARGGSSSDRGASLAVLFTCLLAVQMFVFLVQEGLETGAVPGLATIALGLLGQQPVALLGAFALRWLSLRLPAALRTLAARLPLSLPQPVLVGVRAAAGQPQVCLSRAIGPRPARGPPAPI